MGDVETQNPRAEERRAKQDEFEAHVEEFTRYLATVRNLSPNTVRAYDTDLRAYCAWTRREGIEPLAVTHRELRSYLAEFSRAGYSTRTVNRHLSAIRDLYKWFVAEGITEADPADALASPKMARSLPVTAISGQNRSFQWATTEKIENAVIAGHALGTMTRITMPVSDMPSSRAAACHRLSAA